MRAVGDGPVVCGLATVGPNDLNLRRSLVAAQVEAEVGVEAVPVAGRLLPEDLNAAHGDSHARQRAVSRDSHAVAGQASAKAVSGCDAVVAEVLGIPLIHSADNAVSVAVVVEVRADHLAMVAARGVGAHRVVDADARRRVGVRHPHLAARAANRHMRRDRLAVGRALRSARAGAVVPPAVVPPRGEERRRDLPVRQVARRLAAHFPRDGAHGRTRLENARCAEALAASQGPVGQLRDVPGVVEPEVRPWIAAVSRETEVVAAGRHQQVGPVVAVETGKEAAHRAAPSQLTPTRSPVLLHEAWPAVGGRAVPDENAGRRSAHGRSHRPDGQRPVGAGQGQPGVEIASRAREALEVLTRNPASARLLEERPRQTVSRHQENVEQPISVDVPDARDRADREPGTAPGGVKGRVRRPATVRLTLKNEPKRRSRQDLDLPVAVEVDEVKVVDLGRR